MDLLAFAAARDRRLTAADDELRPFVARALDKMTWADLIEAASVLWLEIFEAEAPRADAPKIMATFQKELRSHLEKTAKPTDMDAAIERVTYWLGTFTVNDATYRGNRARGGERMRWQAMKDDAVRTSHRAANGQIASADGTFDIGGSNLRYPGEPVGPPEVWINCRCILVPARVEGFDVATVTAAVPKPEDEDIEIEVDDEAAPEEGEDLPPVDESVSDDDPEDDEEYITEIPVHGVIAPEGVMSGDGRQFDVGALSSRNLPIPLRYEFVSTHGGTTSEVVTIGRVDEAWMEGNLYMFSGVIIVTKDWSMKVIEGIVDGSIRGVSIDGDLAVEREVTEEEFANGMREAYTKVRQAGLTVVPIPAFQETYIALGEKPVSEDDVESMAAALLASCDCVNTIEEARAEIASRLNGPEDDDENPDIIEGYDSALTAAPGTHDGPGWITHPIPTSRIRNYWVRGEGAAKIRWGVSGDFNRCRRQLVKYVQNPEWLAGLCANMHKEAIGVWPGQEGGSRGHAHSLNASAAPAMTLVAAGTVKPAWMFRNPELKEPTPITITPEGHIYGHLATWGVCHVGFQDSCVQAPRSATNYAGFRTGTVHTDEGPIAVGQITMGTGHATISARSKEAVAHYDNTGLAAADVACGDDGVGIWVAGMVRPNLTDEQVDNLQAAALSGDWRRIGASLELVAALAVNVPGFPIPRALAASVAGADDEGDALVAAGVVTNEEPKNFTVNLSKDEVVGLVRASVAEVRHQERMEARKAALTPFFSKVDAAAAAERAEKTKRMIEFFGAEGA